MATRSEDHRGGTATGNQPRIEPDCDNLADGSERDSPWSCGGGSGTGRRPLTSIIEQLHTSKSKLHNGSEKNGFPDAGASFACQLGEVSGENVSAGSGPRSGDRGEGTDLGTHTENNDGATLAANTAVDARGGSPQGATFPVRPPPDR